MLKDPRGVSRFIAACSCIHADQRLSGANIRFSRRWRPRRLRVLDLPTEQLAGGIPITIDFRSPSSASCFRYVVIEQPDRID